MTDSVIDGLEVIQIKQRKRVEAVGPQAAHANVERAPVIQPGQRIDAGQGIERGDTVFRLVALAANGKEPVCHAQRGGERFGQHPEKEYWQRIVGRCQRGYISDELDAHTNEQRRPADHLETNSAAAASPRIDHQHQYQDHQRGQGNAVKSRAKRAHEIKRCGVDRRCNQGPRRGIWHPPAHDRADLVVLDIGAGEHERHRQRQPEGHDQRPPPNLDRQVQHMIDHAGTAQQQQSERSDQRAVPQQEILAQNPPENEVEKQRDQDNPEQSGDQQLIDDRIRIERGVFGQQLCRSHRGQMQRTIEDYDGAGAATGRSGQFHLETRAVGQRLRIVGLVQGSDPAARPVLAGECHLAELADPADQEFWLAGLQLVPGQGNAVIADRRLAFAASPGAKFRKIVRCLPR